VDQTGEGAFTTTSLQVNIDGLNDFRTFLGLEVDANLQPGSRDVINDHTMGVRFGSRNPGHNVGVATNSYHGALDTSTKNLLEYVRTANLLTRAIYIVMDQYRSADLTAGGTSMALSTAMGGAVVEAKSETDRETYRATGHSAATASVQVSPL
jgi:hypothetical protein